MANHRQPVPEWLNEAFLEKALRNSLQDPRINVLKVAIGPGSLEGDNFIGQIFRIGVDFKISKSKEQNISVIGKLKTDTALSDDFAETVDLFQREVLFFSLLQSKLNEVTLKKGGNIFSPKCILADAAQSIILMEDLKSKNYELQPRGKLLNLKQAELLVEALATFHAASLHLLEEDPGLTKIFKGHVFSAARSAGTEAIMNNATKALSENKDQYQISDLWKERLSGLRERMEGDWFKSYDRQDGQLNVLSHGDCWMNNMMFHYSGGQPDKIILLDYQLVNHSSFANDLMHCSFSSFEADVILTKLNYLLERYYAKFVEIAPSKTDVTLERIQSEFHGKYYLGYLMMLFIRPFVLSEKVPDFDLIVQGQSDELGYASQQFIADIEKLLPFFEKLGVC